MTFFTIEQNNPKIHMKSKCQSHPEQKEQCWWDYHIKFQAVLHSYSNKTSMRWVQKEINGTIPQDECT